MGELETIAQGAEMRWRNVVQCCIICLLIAIGGWQSVIPFFCCQPSFVTMFKVAASSRSCYMQSPKAGYRVDSRLPWSLAPSHFL